MHRSGAGFILPRGLATRRGHLGFTHVAARTFAVSPSDSASRRTPCFVLTSRRWFYSQGDFNFSSIVACLARVGQAARMPMLDRAGEDACMCLACDSPGGTEVFGRGRQPPERGCEQGKAPKGRKRNPECSTGNFCFLPPLRGCFALIPVSYGKSNNPDAACHMLDVPHGMGDDRMNGWSSVWAFDAGTQGQGSAYLQRWCGANYQRHLEAAVSARDMQVSEKKYYAKHR